MRWPIVPAFCAVLALACGCDSRRPDTLVLWHTQAQSNARLLQQIVDDYNATNPPMKVSLQYAGDYDKLFKKVRATIMSKQLPDLVVAYESMVAEYIESDAVVPLDDYINDPKCGLSEQSLADIFPPFLENNRYPQYGNKFYSFPFTKSVLMLYYNADMLKAAGFDAPPKTWKQFEEQGLAVKTKLGKKGYAVSVDASTVDAILMSLGGDIISADGQRALFDEPPGVGTFQLIYNLLKSGAAYQVDRLSYGDRKDFSNGLCAFLIRSSTTRPYLASDIKDKFNWDMTIIPHGEGKEPVTVMFGANIAVMKTTPERQRAAWEFIKYFSSKEVTAGWAMGTGYVPIRKSAAETDAVKAFFAESPMNRRAFDVLPCARPEPGVNGWQAARKYIELAESEVLGGRTPPETIAANLNKKVNAVLKNAGQ